MLMSKHRNLEKPTHKSLGIHQASNLWASCTVIEAMKCKLPALHPFGLVRKHFAKSLANNRSLTWNHSLLHFSSFTSILSENAHSYIGFLPSSDFWMIYELPTNKWRDLFHSNEDGILYFNYQCCWHYGTNA